MLFWYISSAKVKNRAVQFYRGTGKKNNNKGKLRLLLKNQTKISGFRQLTKRNEIFAGYDFVNNLNTEKKTFFFYVCGQNKFLATCSKAVYLDLRLTKNFPVFAF